MTAAHVVRAACASHIGGREEQQDMAASFSSHDGECHLLVVADGMGGRSGGRLAAETVVDVAAELWANCQGHPDDPHAFLETLCQQAHAGIRQRGQTLGLEPMSTIAALFATSTRAWWVHAGDSRVYAFRGNTRVLRTEDHTMVRKLVATGRLNEAEAGAHPERHLLLRGLGSADGPQPTHGQMSLSADTGFVLCSDGFWNVVRDDELPALLSARDAHVQCTEWAAIAAERGGPDGDNVTVAVLLPAMPGRPARCSPQQHPAVGTAAHPVFGQALGRYWPLFAAVVIALLLLFVHTLK